MLDLKKYKFSEDGDEWYFEEYLESAASFKQSNTNDIGYLSFDVEMSNNSGKDFKKPRKFQENALKYFYENQVEVLNEISKSIIEYFHNIVSVENNIFQFESGKENKEMFSEIEDVKKYISIENVTVSGNERDDISYLIFSCGCPWDGGEGLGILVHKNRILDVGDASSILYDDNDKILQDSMNEEDWNKYKLEKDRQIAENLANYYKEREEILKRESLAQEEIIDKQNLENVGENNIQIENKIETVEKNQNFETKNINKKWWEFWKK